MRGGGLPGIRGCSIIPFSTIRRTAEAFNIPARGCAMTPPREHLFPSHGNQKGCDIASKKYVWLFGGRVRSLSHATVRAGNARTTAGKRMRNCAAGYVQCLAACREGSNHWERLRKADRVPCQVTHMGLPGALASGHSHPRRLASMVCRCMGVLLLTAVARALREPTRMSSFLARVMPV